MLALALALVITLAFAPLLASAAPTTLGGGRLWRYGWGEHPPFEQLSRSGLTQTDVGGMDAELLRAVVELELGGQLRAEPSPQSVESQINAIRQGQVDVITDMEGRQAHRPFAHFSDPYRKVEMVVMAPAGDPGHWMRERSSERLMRDLQRSTAAVGVLEGWSYGTLLDRWLEDAAGRGRRRIYRNPKELAAAVENGEVQLGLGERLSLASALWGADEAARTKALAVAIAPAPFLIQNSCFMFSARKVSVAEVRRFNQALAAVRGSETYARIVRTALFPVLLEFTAGRWWFYPVELLGVFAAAVSGAVQALRSGFSLVGLVIVAMVTSVGGGLLRDILINLPVPSVLMSPIYIGLVYIGVILVIVAAALGRPMLHSPWLDRCLDGLDALGIAAFTVTGVLIALRMRAEPLLLWGPLLSVLTAGGGLLAREVILGRGRQALRPGSLYHEISFACSLLFSLFLSIYSTQSTYRPRDIEAAVLITMLVVALLRLGAIHAAWRSPALPESRR